MVKDFKIKEKIFVPPFKQKNISKNEKHVPIYLSTLYHRQLQLNQPLLLKFFNNSGHRPKMSCRHDRDILNSLLKKSNEMIMKEFKGKNKI